MLGVLAVTAVTAYAQSSSVWDFEKQGCPKSSEVNESTNNSEAQESYASKMEERTARQSQIKLLEQRIKSARRCESRWQQVLYDQTGDRTIDYASLLITDEMENKQTLLLSLEAQIEALEATSSESWETQLKMAELDLDRALA